MEKNIRRIGFNGRPFCQPGMRGLGKHTLELIKSLKEIQPGLEFYIYSYGKVSEYYKKELSFAHFRDFTVRPKILWDLWSLEKALHQDQIDIYHSTNNVGVPFLWNLKIPVFLTIHDHFTHQSRNKLNFNIKSLWDFVNYRLEYFLLKKADGFFTVSESAKKDICQHIGLLPEKILVTYNGVSAPAALTNGPKKNYFLYVGGLEERKNILMMLEAFIEYTKSAGENLRLRIVADPSSAGELVRDILKRYPHLFELQSNLSVQELNDLYLHAQALIFPSKKEGFGLPLVEAMAHGCPVIASDIPVFREVAQNAAVFFDPESCLDLRQKLELLVNNSELKSLLVETGYKRVSAFTWRENASKVLKQYETIFETAMRKL